MEDVSDFSTLSRLMQRASPAQILRYSHGFIPLVAERMNNLPKIVFSRTLDKVDWNNTRLVKDDMLSEIRRMKQDSGNDLAVLGSGSIVSQLAHQGLIDEYQIMVNPVVIGKGKTMFQGIQDKLALKLTKTRIFDDGNVLLHYEPAI
ncbi:MAG: dihydrofolate reductase family protein [Desulfobacterales bacterium]